MFKVVSIFTITIPPHMLETYSDQIYTHLRDAQTPERVTVWDWGGHYTLMYGLHGLLVYRQMGETKIEVRVIGDEDDPH